MSEYPPEEQRIAKAAILCETNDSWEHHDQTDGFPCSRCIEAIDKETRND